MASSGGAARLSWPTRRERAIGQGERTLGYVSRMTQAIASAATIATIKGKGCVLCERKGFWFNPGFNRSGECRGSQATSGPLPLAQPKRQRPAPSTRRRRRAFSTARTTVAWAYTCLQWTRSSAPGGKRHRRPMDHERGQRSATSPPYRSFVLDVAAAPSLTVLRSTSKMTAVDQPNSSTPFIAVIGPSSRQRSTGVTSP